MIEEYAAQLQACMYQYSRAIYRSIKDLIDPYVAPHVQLEYRRAVLEQCEQTMERLAKDPLYFARPDRALFQDIRRYFPITAQAEVGSCSRAAELSASAARCPWACLSAPSGGRPSPSTAASPARAAARGASPPVACRPCRYAR